MSSERDRKLYRSFFTVSHVLLGLFVVLTPVLMGSDLNRDYLLIGSFFLIPAIVSYRLFSREGDAGYHRSCVGITIFVLSFYIVIGCYLITMLRFG
jgi:hypothetical protein